MTDVISVLSPGFKRKRILEPAISAHFVDLSIPPLTVYDVIIIGKDPYEMP
jgi:hypothetical protein